MKTTSNGSKGEIPGKHKGNLECGSAQPSLFICTLLGILVFETQPDLFVSNIQYSNFYCSLLPVLTLNPSTPRLITQHLADGQVSAEI